MRKNINYIFAGSMLVLMLLSFLTFTRLNKFNGLSNVIADSQSILNTIADLRSNFNNLTAEQRSFLLFGEEKYLDNLRKEVTRLRRQLNTYGNITKDNEVHRIFHKRLTEAAETRISKLNLEILHDTTTRSFKTNVEDLMAVSEESRLAYYETLDKIQLYESQRLKEITLKKEYEEKFTPVLLLILSLLSLFSLSVAFYMIIKQLEASENDKMILDEHVTSLNRSNQELEQFAYVASHDLQEPLRKIQLFSEKLLQTSISDNPDQVKLNLERINNSASRMSQLIRDLLSFSLLNSDNSAHTAVDLNEIMKDIKNDMIDDMEQTDIDIDIRTLPVIDAVPLQMRQLFENLLSNAIKYRKDDIPLKIIVKCDIITEFDAADEPIKFHRIQFVDNGIGFDNSYKAKIFKIFGRLSTKTDVKGTGIGLSICTKIMELHHGKIDADGVLGEGATFYLYFPIPE